MNTQDSQRISKIHPLNEMPPSVRLIQQRVADAWEIPLSELLARTRGPSVDDPRAVAMMLCRELLHDVNLGTVAACFARRCKGSIIIAVRVARDHIDVEPAFASKVRLVRTTVENELAALSGASRIVRAG